MYKSCDEFFLALNGDLLHGRPILITHSCLFRLAHIVERSMFHTPFITTGHEKLDLEMFLIMIDLFMAQRDTYGLLCQRKSNFV